MRMFTALYSELDRTTKTTAKVAALRRYFLAAPAEDAAWGLYFLLGNRIPKTVTANELRAFVSDRSGIPLWLVEESYDAVGDLAETVALLLPWSDEETEAGLREVVEQWTLPLAGLSAAERYRRFSDLWSRLGTAERLVWHKLLTGELRVGVSRSLVIRALAEAASVSPATMAHRVLGKWRPNAEDFQRLLLPVSEETDPIHPYPFALAHPLDFATEGLGAPEEWIAEWKWDGIRAQIIARAGQLLIWSRGEEAITDGFPEVALQAAQLPGGTVLDGELLAWEGRRPLPFSMLQRRISRKQASPRILREVPVIFMAYDLLEWGGEDLREEPLERRKAQLRAVIVAANTPVFCISEELRFASWAELDELKNGARERHVEGLMLKRKSSQYAVGRKRGNWWKWKVDPFSLDAVLIAAQRGHGRRASLYTDYTFGVWRNEELVPVAKAYSGLSDDEIREVDRFVRNHTVERHGPVRVVEPKLVFELAFEAVRESRRHRSGFAVRFPRIARWRKDKIAEEADSLEAISGLLRESRQLSAGNRT